MQLNTYCDIFLKENNLACFVASYDTCEVLYVNDKMNSLIKNSTAAQNDDSLGSDLIGKRFYDIIKQDGVSFPHSSETGLNFGQYFEEVLFDTNLNLPIRSTLLRFRYEKQFYILCKYKIGDTSIDDESIEYAMTECINILQQEDNKILPSMLDLLGTFYKCDKTYIYLINYDEVEISSLSTWVANPSMSIVKNLSTRININLLLSWLDNRNESGIIEADLNHASTTKESAGYKILSTFGISNLIISGVEDSNGKLIGLVGLVDRKKHKKDYRLLQTIGQFVAQRLTNQTSSVNVDDIQNKDILTNFFNRNAYSQRVEELNTIQLISIGVVFVNVNGLKKINADYGYARGDDYIKEAAILLSAHFPDVDIFRISGDEFVAFFTDFDKLDFEERVTTLHREIRDSDNQLFALGHTWTNGRYNLFSLVQEADNLMYINKQEYYHTSKRSFDDISDSTLSDLLTFLADDEFMVYLQPQVELKTGEVVAAEALIRRFDKINKKMVFPDQFIPMYEQKSIIRHVDMFVIRKVCQTLAKWSRAGREISIAVNLSRVTLMEFNIVQTIAKICDQYKVPRHLLIIEVTERVGLIENDVNTNLIDEFKDEGFKVSLDDFGCAYSNIVTLANISVDEVKIDKSLVDNILENRKNKVIVQSVISMCDNIGDTHTLAEGIEYVEQATILNILNCKYGQGYLYSRPIPLDEFYEKYIQPKPELD